MQSDVTLAVIAVFLVAGVFIALLVASFAASLTTQLA